MEIPGFIEPPRPTERAGAHRAGMEGLAVALGHGIEAGHVHLAYQPVACLSVGLVHGAEVFPRWCSPGELVRPMEDLIPLAEATSQILPLASHVLEQVLASVAQAGPPTQVTVNLSSQQLRDGRWVTTVARLLDRLGVPAGSLSFELGAGAALRDLATVRRELAALRDIGCRVGIDDFGADVGSMRLLSSLPIDFVKIDRAVVGRLLHDPDVVTVVSAIVHRAQQEGIATVAEGVDRIEQAEWLRDLGCQLAQGDHFDASQDWLVLPTPHRCAHG
jgi:EAL domain-containing protein (putative c-di-GMP-specific phosphodiesterase class I)